MQITTKTGFKMNKGYDSFRLKLSEVSFSADYRVSVSEGRSVVSSVSRWATELGVEVLREGGNAFDAAFALGFSLALFHPQAGNIGGGGYLLYYRKGWESPAVINYREKAPVNINISTFFNNDGTINPDKTAFGPTSVCTPGMVKAFFYLHNRYGKIKPGLILKKIASLCRKGYPLTKYQTECLNRLSPKLSFSDESREIYVKKDGQYRPGDVFKNERLGRTLEILGEYGDHVFYKGQLAEAMVKDIREHGGFLSSEDLEDYSIKEVKPIFTEIEGKKVWTVPPEGGGSVLINLINILNNENFKRLQINGIDYIHRFAQALKLAFVNRYGYMGEISLEENIYYSRIFEREFWQNIYFQFKDTDQATGYYCDLLDINVEENSAEGDNTTHFSIIDADGNAVSNSYTLNLRYGSKWSVRGYGYLLNGSMDAFSFKPGKTNYFGVLGNKANIVAPGKRPASSMAPVIVTDNDGVFALIGTPGGPTIPSTIFNFLWPIILKPGIDPVELIKTPRIHHQAWPDVLYLEKGYNRKHILNELKELGYNIKYKEEPIGDIHAVIRHSKRKGMYTGISDFRREGFSMAF